MVPHVIHRVWLGSDPMPDEFEYYGETWQRHHPGWELQLWTDSNLPELRYPEALERCRNHGERSDVLRSELLHRFGGVYADTDVECRRSLEPLIKDVSAFAAWVRPGRVGSAVLGAVPGHPAIERLLTEMQARVGKGSQIEATVGLLTTVLSEAPDVEIFDSETFYPYHPRHNPAKPGDDFPNAYAVHHWGLTWKTRDELRERVRGLRDKLEATEAENRRLKRQRRRLRKRLKRARATGKRQGSQGSGRVRGRVVDAAKRRLPPRARRVGGALYRRARPRARRAGAVLYRLARPGSASTGRPRRSARGSGNGVSSRTRRSRSRS